MQDAGLGSHLARAIVVLNSVKFAGRDGNHEELFDSLLDALVPDGFIYLGGLDSFIDQDGLIHLGGLNDSIDQTEVELFEEYLEGKGVEYAVIAKHEYETDSGRSLEKLYRIKDPALIFEDEEDVVTTTDTKDDPAKMVTKNQRMRSALQKEGVKDADITLKNLTQARRILLSTAADNVKRNQIGQLFKLGVASQVRRQAVLVKKALEELFGGPLIIHDLVGEKSKHSTNYIIEDDRSFSENIIDHFRAYQRTQNIDLPSDNPDILAIGSSVSDIKALFSLYPNSRSITVVNVHNEYLLSIADYYRQLRIRDAKLPRLILFRAYLQQLEQYRSQAGDALFPDDAYDLVYSVRVVQAEFNSLLIATEEIRVAKPGGIIVHARKKISKDSIEDAARKDKRKPAIVRFEREVRRMDIHDPDQRRKILLMAKKHGYRVDISALAKQWGGSKFYYDKIIAEGRLEMIESPDLNTPSIFFRKVAQTNAPASSPALSPNQDEGETSRAHSGKTDQPGIKPPETVSSPAR